ncbi:hypothetical protein BDV96DRAFT_647616 [Lophiotrema nucula]|uniref:Transcription factor hoxa13 n=1 Tax=Lophiotrema nucula TaxID=690887 RepID=A0A6A5Z423_9PLEO|nr:hypothetical protein BDV96DRAFT_647616 [Lophiotrema nucula]
MGAQSNGKAKKPKSSAQNGHLNGHLNGHMNGSAEKTSVSKPATQSWTRAKPRRSMGASLISIIGRIIIWYTIITIALRCPPSISKLSDDSPKLCTPYLHARSYAAPYLDPYYQTYVAPQMQKVQPYVDRFDSQVYTPVSTFTKDKYATYGAHRVDAAQKYLQSEWDRTVHPQLQNAQTWTGSQYKAYLEPRVAQASEAVSPYYEKTKESCVEIYHLSILPLYEKALPYSKQAYAYGHHAVSHIIFPYVRTAKDTSLVFITRTLWPQLRVLYGDNVEPQLVRISERLGRYKDQKKMESVADAVESETSTISEIPAPTEDASSTASPSSTTTGNGWGVLDNLWPSESSSTPSKDVEVKTKTASSTGPKLTGAELRESLNNDLRNWQSKFATAADKGSEDLERRVADITKRQVENGVKGHGAALVTQLEETSESTIAKFKQYIKEIVETTSEESTEQELETAYEKCIGKTRELGFAVKEKAQAVRTWKANYDQETDSLVKSAVESTVAVLDRIHSLGLQEVGMRWAWTDGVTYNDWQNYHKLRETLTEWEAEVEAVGTQHDGLRVAHLDAKNLEDDAMAIASKMVNELVRLKEVAKWKIWAGDATDDFSNKKVPVRVFNAAQSVASNVEHISAKASEAILGSETPTTESIASAVRETVSAASSKIVESAGSIVGSGSAASSLSSKVSEASSQVSEAVVGSESDAPVKSLPQDAKEAVKEAASATKAPKKVFGGANAQVIAEAKQIIFDDVIDEEETYSQRLQSLVAEAGDHAADLTKAVSEALFKPTPTQGTVESVTSLASEQYEKALSAASSVLYGTEQQRLESITSLASGRYAQAVSAASYAIYGTPAPTALFNNVQSEASSRYSDTLNLANEQYTNAKSQLSALVSGTPKPAHETLLSMVDKAYSDSVAAASERLQAALQYTDSIKSYAAGPTQGYFESVSSVAASKLSEGLSAATAQFTSQPTPALEGARRQYYEAIGLAHARYSEFLGAASSAVYGPQQGTVESIASVISASAASAASQVSSSVIGTETPWAESVVSDISGSAQSVGSKISEAAGYVASEASSSAIGTETPWTESVASQASQNWEALIAKASSQVYGAPTPWTESVYSQAGAYGAQATAQAVEQYAAVSALISELVIGKEPDYTESVLNRLSSAYSTGFLGAVSSVGSYASENYEAASSLANGGYDAATSYVADAYASASSAVSSVFTPPPAVESILAQASEQIEAAVESASVAVYGTPKGRVEEASESVASAYSSVQSKASEAIYGTKQVQDSFTAVAASAQAAVSEAIFGTPTPTGYIASATSGAEGVYGSVASAASDKAADAESIYSSISSVAGEKVADALSAAKSAIYGPEQGAVESASSRVAAAIEAANSRIADLYANAATSAEDAASSASSLAAKATDRVKDEL